MCVKIVFLKIKILSFQDESAVDDLHLGVEPRWEVERSPDNFGDDDLLDQVSISCTSISADGTIFFLKNHG
jgi:hypothetical protein